MIALLKLLPLVWRIVAVASIVTAISATIYAMHRSVYNSGYEACKTHITEKIREQNDEARKKIIALEAEYKQRTEDVSKTGNNALVGPGVSRAIDLLP
jgi:hypothetical protein